MSVKMSDLLRYRNVWLGCAMLWIMSAHSGLSIPYPFLSELKSWGYGGVDICLFASGIGCYFSLEKDPDGLRFLKRRVIRLAPAYLCFMAVWCALRVAFRDMPLQAVVGNLLGIQSLTGLGNSLNWYIGGLVVYYLLSPYLKSLADRRNHPRQHLAVIAVLLLVTVACWKANSLIIVVTRLPVIYLGMVFAKQCRQEKRIGWKEITASVLAMAAGFVLLWLAYRYLPEVLWSHGLHWYPFILITPGLCILISLITMGLEICRPGRWLVKFPEMVGRNSFEVFLVHVPLFEACLYEGYLEKVFVPLVPGRLLELSYNWAWLWTIPVVAGGCVLLKGAEKLVVRLWRKCTASV